jgi:translocation and assembly module TamA
MSKSMSNMSKHLLIYLIFFTWVLVAQANENQYQVKIDTSAYLRTFLLKHLDIIKWQQNPRLTLAEWRRLNQGAKQNIESLLRTEGYFSPSISQSMTEQNNVSTVTFKIEPGPPLLVDQVEISFTGEIANKTSDESSTITKFKEDWLLKPKLQFRQDDWDQAKRKLLTAILIERYPNAAISNSSAIVNPDSNTAKLIVEIDSGPSMRFGNLTIVGLKRYPASIVENLNPIKAGSQYSQSQLLTFQSRLQESGYFRSVEVIANTKATNPDGSLVINAPIKVTVNENKAVKLGVGAGYSTNTGARTQVSVDHLNIFNLGWRLKSSLKFEQKAQSLESQILLPTNKSGYRDSISASVDRTAIEGQTIISTQTGVKRAWGGRRKEQYVSANLLSEQVKVDGAKSSNNFAGTLTYGITLRLTNSLINPTSGYLLNAQFTAAPLDALSDGTFLQTYLKAQAYYPITSSTQLITRAEIGMVNGKNSAPEAFLFRAGGDQSVRGYGYQSLGVTEGDAIVGGRYLATGSVEVVQWLTEQWGSAVFVDFGNAANSFKDLKPVFGYGLGLRWKSPVGPVGADVAYGEKTDEYRLHFNIGVAF